MQSTGLPYSLVPIDPTTHPPLPGEAYMIGTAANQWGGGDCVLAQAELCAGASAGTST